MDLAEPITVLVAGVFASTMTDGLVAVAETRKSGVDAILVGLVFLLEACAAFDLKQPSKKSYV